MICNVTHTGWCDVSKRCRRCLHVSVFKKILLYHFNLEISIICVWKVYLKSAGCLKGEMWTDLKCFISSRATERACLMQTNNCPPSLPSSQITRVDLQWFFILLGGSYLPLSALFQAFRKTQLVEIFSWTVAKWFFKMISFRKIHFLDVYFVLPPRSSFMHSPPLSHLQSERSCLYIKWEITIWVECFRISQILGRKIFSITYGMWHTPW